MERSTEGVQLGDSLPDQAAQLIAQLFVCRAVWWAVQEAQATFQDVISGGYAEEDDSDEDGYGWGPWWQTLQNALRPRFERASHDPQWSPFPHCAIEWSAPETTAAAAVTLLEAAANQASREAHAAADSLLNHSQPWDCPLQSVLRGNEWLWNRQLEFWVDTADGPTTVMSQAIRTAAALRNTIRQAVKEITAETVQRQWEHFHQLGEELNRDADKEFIAMQQKEWRRQREIWRHRERKHKHH